MLRLPTVDFPYYGLSVEEGLGVSDSISLLRLSWLRNSQESIGKQTRAGRHCLQLLGLVFDLHNGTVPVSQSSIRGRARALVSTTLRGTQKSHTCRPS